MLKKLKKTYRTLRVLLKPHPLYRIIDKFKLVKIKKGDRKSGFVVLRPKGLKHSVKIRKNYTDREVLNYVLQDQYHVPPKSLKIPKKAIILDLGSNIGLTLVHFRHLYPDAKIIGYEMNKGNFKLAHRNTKFYKDISINNMAVWIEDSTVSYKDNSTYDSYSILNKSSSEKNRGEIVEVKSISIPTIIKTNDLHQIDYLKMDIEGAEEAILKSNDLNWLNIVNALNIEMHLDNEVEIYDYIKILEDKGFKAWKDDKHWSSIIAVRK